MSQKKRTEKSCFRFERRVANIYRELDAKVEHDKCINGFQVDVYAVQQAPDGSIIRTAIECKEYSKPVGVSVIVPTCERFNLLRNQGAIDKGVMVAAQGFTHDARAQCKASGIECFTISDLQRRCADFSTYLREITESYQQLEVAKKNLFIDLSAKTESGHNISSIHEFVETWLQGSGQLLTLLGEYGSGKTTTSCYLANEYAEQHMTCPEENRIPIVIELRNFGRHFNLRGFLTDFILNQKKTNIKSYSTFERLNSEGRFLLIFDGFDEMAIRSDLGLIKQHFSDIQALAVKKAKIIITCRTSFFKDTSDIDRLHMGTDLYELLHTHRTYQVIFLEPFGTTQVQDYMHRYYLNKWFKFFYEIEKREDLRSLASRPILLNLLVKAISNPDTVKSVNSTWLYEKAVEAWIARDDWRCKLTPEQRATISKKLAFLLVKHKRVSIHHKELRELIPELLSDTKIDNDILDQYSQEVRTCSFLRNDLQGFYSFVHKSFAEFLAAQHMFDAILGGDQTVLATEVSIETLQFLCGLITRQERDILPQIMDWFSANEDGVSKELSNTIKPIAAYIIHKCGANVTNINLSGSRFPEGMSLRGVDMSHANLKGARGKRLNFNESDLSGAVLKNTALTECSFVGANIHSAVFANSDLSGSNFLGADLSKTDFQRCRLENTFLTPEDGLNKICSDCLEAVVQEGAQLRSALSLENWLKKTKPVHLTKRTTKSKNKWASIAAAIRVFLSQLDKCLAGKLGDKQMLLLKNHLKEFQSEIRVKFHMEKDLIHEQLEKAETDRKKILSVGDRPSSSKLRKNILRKRELRREHRYLTIQEEVIMKRAEILLSQLNACIQKVTDYRKVTKRIETDPSKAIFSDAIGLKPEQYEWLTKHGAIISCK